MSTQKSRVRIGSNSHYVLQLDMQHYLQQKKNKRAQGPWVAHLKMPVRKVKEKHHSAHQTVLMMGLTVLSVRRNMTVRLNIDFFHVFSFISLCKTCDPMDGAIFGPRGLI